ncbi:MAG: insulinase family protein [Kiritimatiellae bacterium]|nr:insulinase family protein [Kiritimatiellia bacterium]
MKNVIISIVAVAAGAAMSLCAAENFAAGDKVSGFAVKSVTDLPEVKGRMVRMEYEKNGAELIWFDRDDDCKTFAIGFRTLPYDDTGVPHIIEHSVLCGSEKYPVKDPFVQLAKGSFTTFLNAFTSPDCTCYPVCSRNQQELLNLMDVYMDAVLHPLSVQSPLAFKQEGWHYELDGPDGELKRNGIVYSEMKGGFSNPERLLYTEVSRLLYPDTTYGFVSGGDPAAIPTLTFEMYKSFYNRFYHPSNARIFLDGNMDVKAVLAKLDSFLSPYERKVVDAPVKFQRPVSAEKTMEYEIGADEKSEGKVYVATGWVCGRFDEREKSRALEVLVAVIAGDNSSPLKKALVDAGLCEDLYWGCSQMAQIRSGLTVKGVKAENVDAVRNTISETLSRLAAEGLDHARIEAVLDRTEFNVREKDTGSTPRGLDIYFDASSLWNYGGDPADAFRNDAIFASLRGKIATGGFEKLLKECFIDNPHVVRLTMTPSKTIAAERAEAEKKALAAIKAGWSKEELDKVLAECSALKKFQADPSKPEDLAKLPRLSLSDIPEMGTYVPREIVKAGGVTVVRPHTHANGILHAECHFSAEDFTAEELADLPFLAHLFTNLRTSRRSLDDLRNFRDGRLGRFYSSVGVYSSPKDGEGRPYFTVRVSALESRADDALGFVPEVLRETQFDDIKAIGKLLRQDRLDAEQMPNGISGSHFANSRATAQLTSRGAMDEIIGGIAHIRHLQKVDDDFAEHGADFAKHLAGLAAKLFTRDRLVVCLPDNIPISWAERIAEAFPRGEIGPRQEIKPFPRKKEGFRTLGTISGTAMVAHPAKYPYSGKAIVAARVLSYGYLWEEIRVKGGAYGGNFGVGRSGDASWSSWNDPKPARTLDVYAGCGKALRAFADGDDSLDSQIVSAIARSEPYQTPSAETYSASSLWLSGRTPDDLQRTRSEMLKTTKQDLRAFADEVDAMTSSTAICIVGGAQLVDSCTNLLDHVETLAR